MHLQDVARLPDLVPLRYGRMAASPFAYFRGAALPMAADLARVPSSGIVVQLCGDAHLSNFGLFASPERRTVFDLNDFDETHPGPFEWDLKRLATSFVVLGRARGLDAARRGEVVTRLITSYRDRVAEFAPMGFLEQWYTHLPADRAAAIYYPDLSSTAREKVERLLTKSSTSNSLKALSKLTELRGGERVFSSDPPTLMPIEEIVGADEAATVLDDFAGLLGQYLSTLQSDRRRLLERYELTHIARKVVGVGSVGTRAWVLLLTGRDEDDPLLLQAKQANQSVLEPYTEPSPFSNHAERVVAGQHLLQAVSDIFLGWQQITGSDGVRIDYYLRQLRDGKASIDADTMLPSSMPAYAGLCGWALARAHARSGSAPEISGYLGEGRTFTRAIVDFAERYADLNEADHRALVEGITEGRIAALEG